MSTRKDNNRTKNEAQHRANIDRIDRAGILPRESRHTKTRTGKDGKTYEAIVSKNVRPSKLIRSDRRRLERMSPPLAADSE